jgi:hypothetical protein
MIFKKVSDLYFGDIFLISIRISIVIIEIIFIIFGVRIWFLIEIRIDLYSNLWVFKEKHHLSRNSCESSKGFFKTKIRIL